jgi:ERCC4-type nuclease
MSLTSVMIDTFEPTHIQGLTFGGIPTAIVPLDAGDILAACDDGNLVIVERKTSGDLLNTLKEERLFSQVTRCHDVTPWAYLIVTGLLAPSANGKCVADRGETGWSWASVAGALLTVQELGVGVLHIANDLEFERAVIQLSNRDRRCVRVAPPRNADIISDQDAILSILPGIGPERAKALLDYCGNAASAIDYLTDPTWTLGKVPGIGEQTQRKVRRAFGLPDGVYLGLKCPD